MSTSLEVTDQPSGTNRILFSKPLVLTVRVHRRKRPHEKDPRPGLLSAHVISLSAEGPHRGRNILAGRRYTIVKRARRRIGKLLLELLGAAPEVTWEFDATITPEDQAATV